MPECSDWAGRITSRTNVYWPQIASLKCTALSRGDAWFTYQRRFAPFTIRPTHTLGDHHVFDISSTEEKFVSLFYRRCFNTICAYLFCCITVLGNNTKVWVYVSDVCIAHWGRTIRYQGYAFFPFDKFLFCSWCTAWRLHFFHFQLALRLAYISGLGDYFLTVPSVPSNTWSPNTVGNNTGTRASCCFAPCRPILIIKVNMNQLNSFA